MPCYSPITAWRSRHVNKTGKRSLVFNEKDGYSDMRLEVPCGRCVGCRIQYSRQWAVRCMHESTLYTQNSFITLTYSPENLPEDHSIHLEHLQKFFKRLRKQIHPRKIRYFACGEYGENKNRPHYHAIIFNYDFPDKRLHTKQNGNLLYRSELLEKVWTEGYSMIGNVTFESCAYVARYVMKKRKGDDNHVDKHGKTNASYYEICDPETGEIHTLNREFCTMSRRPGIGKDWCLKYKTDLDKDFLTIDGKKHKLPKYYDSILEKEDELAMLYRKNKRRREAEKREDDNTIERLQVREKVQIEKMKLLKRNIEEK